MASLKQQIEKKAIELGDELRDNLALDSIAKAQIIKSLREFESFVLGLFADCVCIPRKQLEDLWKKLPMITMGSIETHYAARDHIHKTADWIEKLEELLELGDEK